MPPSDLAFWAKSMQGQKKVLTVEIYGQYDSKNLDLLDQGPHGIFG